MRLPAEKRASPLDSCSEDFVQVVAALAGIASVLVCWVVSLRLLALARRTGQVPERLIGLGLLLTGGLWSPLTALGRQATAASDDARVALVVLGALAAICGTSCIAIFNWRVFRPGAAWAPVLAGAAGAALVAMALAQTLGAGWIDYARHERGPWIGVIWVSVAVYAWSSLEAWRQYSMLARRLRLGISDPVVTDRMRIWTFLMVTSFAASLVFAVFQMLRVEVAGTVLGLAMSAAAAALSAVFLLLVFMPPASYLEAVRRRAQPLEA